MDRRRFFNPFGKHCMHKHATMASLPVGFFISGILNTDKHVYLPNGMNGRIGQKTEDGGGVMERLAFNFCN